MAHIQQREFCEKIKKKHPQFFKNKKVLDIGSLDINGTNKTLFENCNYIGLDIAEGKNVDTISIGHLYDGPSNYFDVIISTEVFEHDMYYNETITNIIRMLKPGGLFLFTCASIGRPEHGTRRTNEFDAPLLIKISEEWADYYKNLTEDDFHRIPNFNNTFPDGYFEYSPTNMDLYFYGFKNGSKYLIDLEQLKTINDEYDNDIFVIDNWIDNESKENSLIELIKILKNYNIPILLTGHYPVRPEIQKMVDYYLFDKNNPLLTFKEYSNFGVGSGRWSIINNDIRIDNTYEFHHDYAIWESMRNAFNFVDCLGKKHIHFLEYDNLPDPIQYRQGFLEQIINHDAIIYEYRKNSSKDHHLGEYCATFIFSIKTDIALKIINQIKTKEDYYINRPNGWQLEHVFLSELKKLTNDIMISPYIANSNELNTQAVWNRDGMDRNGAKIQIYLGVDVIGDLYLHTISGFHIEPAAENYLIETVYDGHTTFSTVIIESYGLENIGKYKKGNTVRVYHQGIEIFTEFLGLDVDEYRKLNKITKNIQKSINHIPKEIFINFIDGPFIEINDDEKKQYHVEFIDMENGNVEFELDLESNHWARSVKKYHIDWMIKINGIDNDFHYEHVYNPTGRKILISFESKALGDTLAWIPHIEKYRVEKKCEVICSTFNNKLFVKQYPNIKFIHPGTNVTNIYALFRVGLFKKDNKIDFNMHKVDPRTVPLGKICTDTLGLEYEELKPLLPILSTKKKKIVSIATHGTAQCKYWNNPNGWQEVVDYLVLKGYEVLLLSKEESGYMGNKNPMNVTKIEPGPIENILKIIQESEFFIGISSGLSWLSWAIGTETILISGFTDAITEPTNGIRRIINKEVCNGCWNKYDFDAGDWNWCPEHKGDSRQFECSKTITSEQVIKEIDLLLK